MPARVTICIPNRNTRPFLEERRDSILRQTLTDWEVVVVDDGSTDGAWEFFEQWATQDSRVTVFRGPGRGLYAGWNDAIRRATGQYIHIATSDDTMDKDFLRVMVDALQSQPECLMAQCELNIIDEQGRKTADQWQHIWRIFQPELAGRYAIRKAPHDGILHFGLGTVYISINQLLLRRELFDLAGYFRTDLGVCADFEWEMRAGLLCDVLHVPLPLASWRRHPGQATNDASAADEAERLLSMTGLALAEAVRIGAAPLPPHILCYLEEIYMAKSLLSRLSRARTPWNKLRLLAREYSRGNRMARPLQLLNILRNSRNPEKRVHRALLELRVPNPLPLE